MEDIMEIREWMKQEVINKSKEILMAHGLSEEEAMGRLKEQFSGNHHSSSK